MIVESLKINNYRNYKQEEIELGPGINIFYGDNGQGKTNLLESVYLCATSRSHRGSKDKELIRFGQEEAHIRILPDKPELKVMQSRYFRALTENLDGMTILWEVSTPNGGIITRDGRYTAPDTAGIYEICAFCQEFPKIRNSVFVIVHE